MKLSVIVPIYKVEEYLKQCVDSILQQTYPDLEIILVDDGSPDGCPAICDEYERADDRVRVIHKPNGGLIAARKSGVEIATGEYITFVDGDDWIAPDMYEKVADSINSYHSDCVITQFFFAYEDHNTASHYLLDQPYYNREAMEQSVFPKMLFSGKWYQFGIFPNCWTKVFKADILRKHIFDADDRIRLGEDIAFTYPCMMDCQSLSFVDEPLYYYRQNPASMTASYDSQLSKIYLLPYHRVKKMSEELNVNLSAQLPYYLLYLINFVVRNETLSKDKRSASEVLKRIMAEDSVLDDLGSLRPQTLPVHVRMLLFSLQCRKRFLLNVYFHLLKIYLK